MVDSKSTVIATTPRERYCTPDKNVCNEITLVSFFCVYMYDERHHGRCKSTQCKSAQWHALYMDHSGDCYAAESELVDITHTLPYKLMPMEMYGTCYGCRYRSARRRDAKSTRRRRGDHFGQRGVIVLNH